MPAACNIDGRGKRARLTFGLLLVLLGLALCYFWALGAGGAAAWIVTVACLISGAFLMYEGAMGWCAIRAMGFRTPI